MSLGVERKCCCNNLCNCYQDCNGVFGIPNQDKAYECCWSVGDKVRMTHTIETDFDYRAGGFSSKTSCYDSSYICGKLKERSSSIQIQVDYICIGAKGNAHSNIEYSNLPEYTVGAAWKDNGDGADPQINDGWNSPIVIYIPTCKVNENPCSGENNPDIAILSADVGDVWEYGEYTSYEGHVQGCQQNWNYYYPEIYDGFVATLNESGDLYWKPILIPTDSTEELKISELSTFSNCLEYFLENSKTCSNYNLNENGVCFCDCPNNENLCAPFTCKPSGSPSCYTTTTNNPNECVNTEKCNENSPCSCYGIDENGKYYGKGEFTTTQTATIFALDITNDDIQYCSQIGYYIERPIQVGNVVKWQKYELDPYLILFNRPILEWDCDCKDTNDEYILKDGVGKGYKKEVYGGFEWKFWNGSDVDCTLCPKVIKDPVPCVTGCEFVIKEYDGFGDYVPCLYTSALNNSNEWVEEGSKWYPFSNTPPGGVISSFFAADSWNCINAVEAVSSCAGFKSYCIKRRFVTPPKTDGDEFTCPGECNGHYGVMQRKDEDSCDGLIPKDPIQMACKYGCAEFGSCPSDDFKQGCTVYKADDDNPCIIVPSPYQRGICQVMAVHILTIEPVNEDNRRCLWYEYENNRCCGIYPNLEGKDVGKIHEFKTINTSIDFSWTEGIGWKSSCDDLGTPKLPKDSDYQDINNDGVFNYSDYEILQDSIITKCDEDSNHCDNASCAGESPWLLVTDFTCSEVIESNCNPKQDSSGCQFYACNLPLDKRPCCQLPYEIAAVPDTFWPHFKRYDYETENFWKLQQSVSNGNKLVGCSCYRPSCGCISSPVTELPNGRYTLQEQPSTDINGNLFIPQCNPNNYNVLSFWSSCIVFECSYRKTYYDPDIWYCNYAPGKLGEFIKTPVLCEGVDGILVDGCPDGTCPKFCAENENQPASWICTEGLSCEQLGKITKQAPPCT